MCLSSSALAVDENIAVTSVDSEELSEVIKAVYSDEFIENANILDKSAQENFIMGYKLYYISAEDFAYLADESGNIEEILPENYLWLITTASGDEIRIALEDGSWQVIGYKSPADDSLDIVAEKDMFTATQTEQAESFTVLEIPEYHSRFFYYQQDGADYVVPVNARQDLTGLNNNEVYSLTEANSVLQANATNYKLSTGQIYGGININNDEAEANNYYVIYCIIAIVLGVTAYVVIKKNKSRLKE